jgi:hypothetical protein
MIVVSQRAFAAGGFLGWLIPTLRRSHDKDKRE